MRMTTAEEWLWVLCMPEGLSRGRGLPRRRLHPTEWNELCRQADVHGVLASVERNVRALMVDRAGEVAATDEERAACGSAMEAAARRGAERGAVAAVLRHRGELVVAALRTAGIRCVVLKGWVFADRLYPAAGLRPYVDVDLLVPSGAWGAVDRVMGSLGYVRKEEGPAGHGDAWGERQYEHPSLPGFCVEVHANLVNSERLRRAGSGVSVTIDDLTEGAGVDSELSPGALLLIAAVHGAASHGFDKLQHLVDVAQIARGCAGPVDAAWLASAARRTGGVLSVCAALQLAGRVTGEPACERLLRASGLVFARRFWGLMLSEGVVLSAQGGRRGRHSWRRQWFRQRLKAGKRPG